nr:uncharacterized protein LOC118075466 [Zootoca vivipara]
MLADLEAGPPDALLLRSGKPIKQKKDDDSSESSGEDGTKRTKPSDTVMDQGSSSSSPAPGTETSTTIEEYGGYHENDIGHYLDHTLKLPPEKKKELLSNPWVPPPKYDFGSNANHLKRKFNRPWLDQYTPWLVYSSLLKGALCIHCLLFPPAIGTVKGVLGSFIVRPYRKFKDIHEDCRKHGSHYHKTSTAAAKVFLENVPVDVQLQSDHQKTIKENKYCHHLFLASYLVELMICRLEERR